MTGAQAVLAGLTAEQRHLITGGVEKCDGQGRVVLAVRDASSVGILAGALGLTGARADGSDYRGCRLSIEGTFANRGVIVTWEGTA